MPLVKTDKALTNNIGTRMSHPDSKSERDWFKRLFELSPDPAWIIDGNRFVECNEAAIRVLGYANREEFLNVHPSRLSPPKQPDGQDSYSKAESMMAIAKDKGLHRFEWIHTKADGTNFVAEVTLSVINPVDGQAIYCVWRDITERKKIEQQLRVAATAFESRESMVITDADSVILKVNQAFTEATGYTAEEAVGQTPRILKSGRHDADFYREMWGTLLRTGKWRGEIWDKRKNGEIYPKLLTISAVKGDDGGVTHYVGSDHDITKRKAAEGEIYNLAFYDSLTQLPNRRLLDDRLDKIMAASKRSGHYAAVMFLDLDNFKPLNDKHGHNVGDLLLVEAARRIVRCVREVDTVARFGGDEFVVALSELDEDKAESTAQAGIVAEKIRATLAEPYALKIQPEGKAETTVEHHCTSSIGVMLFINHENGAEDILKWADMAMYQAKEAGRNQVRFYESKA